VVASLWPVQDEEAALLFERFYAYIAKGKSVAAGGPVNRCVNGSGGNLLSRRVDSYYSHSVFVDCALSERG
jgi:CHAT domain